MQYQWIVRSREWIATAKRHHGEEQNFSSYNCPQPAICHIPIKNQPMKNRFDIADG